jgi:hypothetical protein
VRKHVGGGDINVDVVGCYVVMIFAGRNGCSGVSHSIAVIFC